MSIKLIDLIKENQLDNYRKGRSGGPIGYKLTKATNVDELLSNIKYINGYLDLSRSNVTTLPANLEVDGYLSLSNTKIQTLPIGLVVNGDLDLINCKNIKTFPADLSVSGNLILNSKSFDKQELKKQLPKVSNIIVASF